MHIIYIYIYIYKRARTSVHNLKTTPERGPYVISPKSQKVDASAQASCVYACMYVCMYVDYMPYPPNLNK